MKLIVGLLLMTAVILAIMLVAINQRLHSFQQNWIHPARRPTGITIHHTEGINLSAAKLREDHMSRKDPNGNPWDDGGYHFLIHQSGEIEVVRPLSEIGAHAGHNDPRNLTDIGIALEDGRHYPVTKAQLESLVRLCADLCKEFDIEPNRKTITPHHEQCPGKNFPLDQITSEIKRLVDENRPLLWRQFEADEANHSIQLPTPYPTSSPSPTLVPAPHDKNRAKPHKPSRQRAEAFLIQKTAPINGAVFCFSA